MRTLDHSDRVDRPATECAKLDPPVLAALRLGAYQLGYTDQAPHAVVDDTVELVRRAGVEARGAVHECGHAPAGRSGLRGLLGFRSRRGR